MKDYYEMKEFDEVLKNLKPSKIVELTSHPLFHKSHSYFLFRDDYIVSYNNLESVEKCLGKKLT